MSTLITGGTGLLGSYLATLLIDRGEKPVLFDINPPHGMLSHMEDRFEFIQGTQSNMSVVLNTIKTFSIDTIYHLGGMLSVPSEVDPWSSFESNVIGTYNVLDAARILGVPKIIYSSTIATFSKDVPTDTIDDTTIQRPSTMYGATKVFGELLGRFYDRKFGIDFRGIRFPSIVGPGAKTAHMSIYNCWAIERPLMGMPYVLRCEPETRCPVMYYKDAARALVMLSRADKSAIETLVYNVAGVDPPFSAQVLVDAVKARISDAELTFDPNPEIVALLREIGNLRFDDMPARCEWGWTVEYPLEAMVDDFIREYHKNTKYN